MDEPTQTTFTDMFKNSFLNMFPETVDPWQLVTVLAVSLLLGLCIYAVARVANVPSESVIKNVVPLYIPLGVALALVTFIPALSTWVPEFVFSTLLG